MIAAGLILVLVTILWFVSQYKKKGNKKLSTAIWILIALSFAVYLLWEAQK